MSLKKLLIYGDDPFVGHTFSEAFAADFEVSVMTTLPPLNGAAYDVVLLLPNQGLIPIQFFYFLPGAIFLMAKETGQDNGAPPFVTRVHLPCRIHDLKTLLRQAKKEAVLLGELVFLEQHKLLFRKKSDQTLALTEKETQMISYLHKKAGVPVGKEELLHAVWQYHPDITSHTLETHIYRLRKKLGAVSMEEMLRFENTGYVLGDSV